MKSVVVLVILLSVGLEGLWASEVPTTTEAPPTTTKAGAAEEEEEVGLEAIPEMKKQIAFIFEMLEGLSSRMHRMEQRMLQPPPPPPMLSRRFVPPPGVAVRRAGNDTEDVDSVNGTEFFREPDERYPPPPRHYHPRRPFEEDWRVHRVVDRRRLPHRNETGVEDGGATADGAGGGRTTAMALCFVRENRALPIAERPEVRGKVTFIQKGRKHLVVHVHLSGVLLPSQRQQGPVNETRTTKHGFHVHSVADFSNGCDSTGDHFNPTNVTHGAPGSPKSHFGDLGNIEVNERGEVDVALHIEKPDSLTGPYSYYGRPLVIHKSEDDLGSNPHDRGSMTTGNAGARIGCCLIRPPV